MTAAAENKSPGIEPYLRRHGEDAAWFMGALFTHLANGDDTEGRFALIETVGRQGMEVPPHTHEREDEAYYVVEGEMRFLVGGRPFEVGPGDFVYLPRDIEHSWKIKSPTAKTLVFIAPAGLEAAFKEMSEPSRDSEPPSGARGAARRREDVGRFWGARREIRIAPIGAVITPLLQTHAT